MHPLGDAPQALGAVVHGVHAGDHGEQHLRRAHVARRLLAPDVLLARLERHAQGGAPRGVAGHPDDAAGDVALVGVARREERGVGPAVPHRYPEPLARADGDVGAPLSRWDEQRQGQQVRRRRDERAGSVRRRAQRSIVLQIPVGPRILHQRADDARLEPEAPGRAHRHLDAAGRGAGAHHGDRLGMTALRHEVHSRTAVRADRLRQVHRLGRRRGFVEQRRVRHLEAGQVRHHRLEVEQRFQPALRDLGLVGRVGGVPAGVLEDVALDHRGGEAPVVAHANEGAEHVVLRRHAAQRLEHLALALGRRQRQRPAQPDVLGHDGVDQLIERVVAEGLRHLANVVGARADVTRDKPVGGEQPCERGGRRHHSPMCFLYSALRRRPSNFPAFSRRSLIIQPAP